MQTFKDKYGQEWLLDMDLSSVRLMEAREFPNLGKITFFPPTENFYQLLGQTEVSFGMIWCLCKDQLEGKTFIKGNTETSAPITNEEEFAHCFNGETLEQSRIALFEELANFFPQMRITLTTLIERYSSLTKMVDRKTATKMTTEMSDDKMEQMIDQALDEAELPQSMQTILNKMNPLPV